MTYRMALNGSGRDVVRCPVVRDPLGAPHSAAAVDDLFDPAATADLLKFGSTSGRPPAARSPR
ncbi:hypothetical protein GCM10009827_067610 [Dactylosporangium maewongense]|uniref:Uncharacterized protein n=1 Tax=Dactylosporangium maewongense TaxID=634393 RepID=A0ABN2BEA6_9ACTN